MAEGDRVALRLTLRGTHRGSFRGVAGADRRVEVMGMAIVRVGRGVRRQADEAVCAEQHADLGDREPHADGLDGITT